MSTDLPNTPSSRFKLRIQTSPEFVTVICNGKLTADIAAEFKQEVRALIPQTKRIILDLNDVGFIDSSGLGAIVSIYVSAKKASCELELVNLSKKVRDLLGMTKILGVFEIASQLGTRIL
jgi:anti-anti-sigma factor